MAKIQDTSQTKPSNFVKGLNKDTDPTYIQEGMWTHARNVVNNSIEGDIGSLTNQPSNFKCPKDFPPGSTMPQGVVARYIIGVIHLFSDKWIIFTAGHNNTGQPIMSEIGLLEEASCTYRPIVQDACLAFDKRYLITGASRLREDCTWQVYWADGLNPDRYLNVGDPQTWPSSAYTWGLNINSSSYTNTVNYYLDSAGGTIQWPGVAWDQKCTPKPDLDRDGLPDPSCIFCKDLNSLNCDKIRLASLVHTPCLKVRLGDSGGTLRNGTYFATIAYSINGIKVGDYFSPSNTQPVWYKNDLQGSLIIEVNADTENFDEFILVVVQNVNQGTVAKQIGVYSTRTQRIELDQIKDDLITVPVRFLPLINPVIETSDQMAEVNDYLLRVGPRSKYDFNYQPLANLIQARWSSVEYPADYYVKGGNKGSYLRDEVYAFFIRWVYNTGDKSASYHIPGRVARDYPIGSNISETAGCLDRNTLASGDRVFEVYNTASMFSTNPAVNPVIGTTTDDGGVVIATGDMGYWESDEQYPDDKPEVWNASQYCWTGVEGQPNPSYDLCGLNIRHHKFPDNYLNDKTLHFESNPNYMTQGNNLKIRIMGVYFENIIYPKDQDGVDIPGIVGYEILRGSREGNKSIIAKGMVNNFRTYDIKGTVKRGRTGLYANYPFNTIKPFANNGTGNDHNVGFNDPYIKVPDSNNPNNVINQTVPRDIISFHSPDTMFRTPFLSFTELKVYGHLLGASDQRFKEPDQHPKWKLISNEAVPIMFVLGIAEAVYSFQGKYIVNEPPPQPIPFVDLATNPVAYAAQYAGSLAFSAATSNYERQLTGYYTGIGSYTTVPWVPPGGMLIDALASIFTGTRPVYGLSIDAIYDTALDAATLAGVVSPSYKSYTRELPKWSYLDPISRALGGLNQFIFYFSEGVDIALRGIYASVKWDQYALQMIAHGFYGAFGANKSTDTVRFRIEDGSFLRDNILELPRYQSGPTAYSYSINNLKRSDTVVLRTDCGVQQNNPDKGPSYITDPGGTYIDQTLQTLGTINNGPGFPTYYGAPTGDLPTFKEIDRPFSTRMASHYAAVKVRLGNQYGQLFSSYQGVKEIVITPCEQTIGTAGNTFTPFQLSVSCPIGGQVEQNKLITSPVFFGGDTYINRYTEKNSMFFFYDWLYGQPDGFEYNYGLRQMIPQPRFVVNSEKFDSSDLIGFSGSGPTATPVQSGWLPTQFYNMDNDNYNYSTDTVSAYPGLFRPKNSYFYLAASSVRDFFVESEVLVDFRIDGDYEWEKSYNPYTYTNLDAMFNMDPQIITRGNWYRYDYSLSISKAFNNLFSAGNLQNRYYDPTVASLCYTYYPNRIIYSLQQQDMTYRGDHWLMYLINNYKDFKSKISGVKSVNKSGIFITFKNDSPAMFQGSDQLQTDLGTKLTIGDGGLFTQPQQSITNADKPYEYGSSQNRLSVIASPAGIYYISQNTGKIFSYGDGLKEISQNGLKWWFNNFLPYKLTLDFPDYPYQDNPVAGIGCQSLYDNENSIIYFCKKDYKLRDEYKGKVGYVPLVTDRKTVFNGEALFRGQGDYFTIQGKGKYLLGDPLLFEDASWTISFDPKNDFFISFHDWHPDLIIPTKTNYLTTKTVKELFNGSQQLMADIWKHNDNPADICGTYCNFYGVDYPFEIEIPVATGQSITTLKSMEYVLECYKRSEYNCFDQYHVLDFNFDRAVVYNTEQVSGYLNLNLFPKNNVALSLQYPKFNSSISVDPTYTPVPGYDVLFSKEENKYRVNQFWDITKDRGEFPVGSGYPPQGPLVPGTTTLLGNYDERQIWETGPSGYKRLLNQNNLDYNKPLLQRKKFRHYINFLSLSRMVSGDVNMIFKIFNVKNQISVR